MQLPKIIEDLREYFKSKEEIEAAYIFGSLIRGEGNRMSDIDIAILVDKVKCGKDIYPYGYKAHVIADLMKLLKSNKIDLVILDEATPLLKHRVIYTGKLIYSQDEKKRVQFQVETINKYMDFKYLVMPH